MVLSQEGSAFDAAMSTDSSTRTAANDVAPAPPPASGKKLHGRAFYESIGSPKFVLAPMVDQSEFVWPLSDCLVTQNLLTKFYVGVAYAKPFFPSSDV